MAVSSDNEEIDSILTSFDQIYQDFKTGIEEINSLRSKLTSEINRREALEIACNDLKVEKERLSKLYTGSLNNLVEELDRRTKCKSLKEEIKRVKNEYLTKEDEYRKAVQALECDYRARIHDFEAQIIGLKQEKSANETTINHLRQDLAAHKSHVQALASRLEKVRFEVESKYNAEIQDLKDCLMIEQEEKRELNKKLQDLEKELLVNKTRLVEQEQDIGSAKHVETLKSKIMKLRKENEILKRKILH